MKLDPANFILATDYSQSFYGTKPPRYKEGLEAWEATMKLARDEMERQGVMVHYARIHINLGQFDLARTNLNNLTLDTYADIKTTLAKKLEREIEKSKKASIEAAAPDGKIATPSAPVKNGE
jgi:hypothetical protein